MNLIPTVPTLLLQILQLLRNLTSVQINVRLNVWKSAGRNVKKSARENAIKPPVTKRAAKKYAVPNHAAIQPNVIHQAVIKIALANMPAKAAPVILHVTEASKKKYTNPKPVWPIRLARAFFIAIGRYEYKRRNS